MFRAGLTRIFCQPWFWLAAAGILLVDVIIVFGHPDNYHYIFELGGKDLSITGLLPNYLDDSILSIAFFSLAAFPVIGIYTEDIINNRMSVLLTRIPVFSYAMVQVFVVLAGSAFCLFLGDAFFVFGQRIIVGVSISGTAESMQYAYDNLLSSGNWLGYLFFWELQRCMMTAFYAVITFLVSFWITNRQFLTVFPMILHYLFIFFLLPPSHTPVWEKIIPRYIYLYMGGHFPDNIMFQGLYAFAYTLFAAFLIGIFLWRILERRRRL